MHHHPFVSVLVLSACAPLLAQAEPARPAPTAPSATTPAAPSPTTSGPSQATAKAENNGFGTRNTAASAQIKPGLK